MANAAVRPIHSYYSAFGVPTGVEVVAFQEPPSDKLAWLQLRELTDTPAKGLALFGGTRAEKNLLYREFRNYVRQAKTYWDASQRIEGSASALPLYYAILNLAKAELLQTHPNQVRGQMIRHGLSMRATPSPSLRGDHLVSQSGVFSLLFEKRAGQVLRSGTSLPVLNLLSLLPEIGHEMTLFGRTRPVTPFVFQTVASDDTSAWSLLAIEAHPALESGEPIAKTISRSYDSVALEDLPNWRDLFALSSRLLGNSISIFQEKAVHTLALMDGSRTADWVTAGQVPGAVFGQSMAAPVGIRAEFLLVPSLFKSKDLVLPLDLARYAITYYLSSLVRYKPSTLDPEREGQQAWLMDSLVGELPVNLIANAVDGITGKRTFFDPSQYRL